jgi:hypothetical protein
VTTSLNPYFGGTNNFAQTNNCPSQLAPGSSCTFSVTFFPSEAGFYGPTNLTIQTSSGPSINIPVTGTGVITGAATSLLVSGNYQFGAQPVNTTSGQENLYFTNTGTQPITIYSFVPSGNFSINTYGSCGTPPLVLSTQANCYIGLTFSPASVGNLTGTLAVNSSVSGSPQVTNLSGLGVASNQVVEFNPSTALSFPDTPQGSNSGNQTVYLQNTGTAPITVYRTVISSGFAMTYSSCEGTVVNGSVIDGLGGVNVCQVNVQFTPSATATGAQTGTLTFIDSAPGSPHVVQLMGTAVVASGTIGLAPSAITFGPQPVGVTTGNQYIYVQNPGNTNVTVTGVSFSGTNATDYSYSGSNCGTPPFTMTAGNFGCYFPVQFTPGGTGSRTATFTVSSSAGNSTSTITGTGLAATQALGITPTSINLGTIVVGQSGNQEGMFLRNTGTETVTFSANATVTGTNAPDFAISNSCGYNGYSLAANSTCETYITFTPSIVGSETATLTFTDSAGTQTVPLSGTGVSTTPTYTLQHYLVSFNTQLQNTTSPLQTYLYFYNNGSSPIALGNVGITGSFVIPAGHDTCSGQTIAASSNCYVYVEFAPTTTGYLTGTLTFKNSGGTALSGVPTVPLAGFSVAQTFSSFLDPNTTRFVAQQVIGTQSSYDSITLYNTGNTALTVGTLTGTNLGPAGASAEFSINGGNGGYDNCSGQTVQAGGSCAVGVTFTPNAAGTQTGTIGFPVTYANSTTTTLTESLTGLGVVEHNSAVLTPPNGAFIDQALNVTTPYNVVVNLNNSGNQPLTVGTLAITNSSEFSTASSLSGYDNCTGQTVQPGNSCGIGVRFTPTSLGAQSGSISFPVTFADHTTTTLTLPLTGKGVAATTTLGISPADLKFTTEIQGVTSPAQGLTVFNTGNLPITFGADTISTNSAEFKISYDSCTGTKLNPTSAGNPGCTINVEFAPSASATGLQTGVLTIGDNATGGPHTVTLSGIAITGAQQILLTPSTLAFGSLAAGATSTTQQILLINRGDTGVTFNSFTLGGTNAGDFKVTYSQCSAGNTLYGHTSCYASVTFNPPTGTTGALSATITESDSGTPGTHTVSLTGTATAPGPAVKFTPSSLAFPTQNVGTTSAAKSVSVTNTGSANLVINSVASSNSTEFPVYNDGCSGTTLTPNQQCVISLQFSPTLGGARSTSVSVADNASGSPQALSVTGTGYGIPAANYTPTSLSFSNTNINASSATQTTTLKNTGTDTLVIGGVALTGGNANQFSQTNTCPASLAPAASCVITVTFKPTVAGSQSASVTVTDNANNLSGSTQSVPLSGTGVAVPTGATSPTMLTFPSTDIGVASSAQTSTLTNSGTGPLTISSIAIGGTNAADYSQTNTCGATLVAGANCKISVTFKPTASGTRTATVTVTDNANNVANSTQTVSLTGTGAGLPAAAVSPSSLTFTDQNVGTTSAGQTVTLSNSGTGPLSIAGIAYGGTNAGDFSTSSNTCGTSLAAGSSCTISVTFKPGAPGSRSGTLTVTDNAGNVANSTQSVALSGTGIGVPTAGVSPSSLTFPSTGIGSTATAQTVTVSNTGTGPLSISSIVIGGANPGDFADTTTCGSTLAAGANCTVSVTFTPAAAGSFSANLHVIDNSGNTGSTQSVTLSGTGAAAGTPTDVSVSPNSGSGLTQTFTAVYSDSSGASQLTTIRFLMNTSINAANGCYVQYTPSTNSMTLENNAGNGSAGTLTPGSGLVSNGQCTLTGSGTTVNISGSTMTVTYALSFSTSFTGTQNVYLLDGTANASSGWVQEGTWTPVGTGPPTVVSVSPSSGSGATQTFTAVYSDPRGYAALTTVRFLMYTSISAANGCYVQYIPSTNSMTLENNAGNGSAGTLTPGSGSILNNQCTLSGSGTTVTNSGNTMTITYALSFTGTFTGSKNVYLLDGDNTGSSNWVQEGTWTP